MIKRIVAWLLKKIEIRRNEGVILQILNHKPDEPDERDYTIKLEPDDGIFNQLNINPYEYVKNQGTWGSCGSHAMCTALEIMHNTRKTQLKFIELSERFHYYWVRQDEFYGTYPEDSGMTSRHMLKVSHQIGNTPEVLCEYDMLEMNKKPRMMADGFAHWWKINSYFRVYDLESVKGVIDNEFPVLVGFHVTNSFMDFDEERKISHLDRKILGGHEVVIYGYNDKTEELLCINSWGEGYKDRGCMRIPYKYFNKFAIDTWMFNI